MEALKEHWGNFKGFYLIMVSVIGIDYLVYLAFGYRAASDFLKGLAPLSSYACIWWIITKKE